MRRISLGWTLTFLVFLAPAAGETRRETPEQFQARTKWWREAKFGMFIHWGIYAVPADSTDLQGHKRIAEWYFSNKQVQVADYEKFASQFDPVQFDARQWVETAKNAGMKYVVITSKHHDGFSMFDTKMTDYNVVEATPWHHDPMKDLAAECGRQGLRLCFYHSVMDWHHPDYLPRRKWDTRPVDGASLDRYIEYMKGELRDLLTKYGPIGILWWDGGWEHTAEEWWSTFTAGRETLFARVLAADPAAHLERVIEHPFFGELNWREALLFLRLHDLDHAGQLQKIASALSTTASP